MFDPSFITIFVVGMILVTTLPVFFIMRRVFGGMKRQQAETRRLLQVGVPASAQILAVQMGGMTVTTGVHRHLQLVLSLQVQAPGRPPYGASLTTMVSELQLPQLQPGAMVQVRIDPADPTKMALEAIGQAIGQAPVASMGGPAAAVPRMQYGAGPAVGAPGLAPGLTPVQTPRMPAGAKVGLIIGIVGGLVGMGVAVAVTLVNVGEVGLDSAPDTSTVCGRAVACCQKVTSGSDAGATCQNLNKVGVPEQVCRSSLDAFQQSAEAQGMTCE
ncbi:MAG: hypothetical protein AAGF11_25245 [Myxococcota bacterium]